MFEFLKDKKGEPPALPEGTVRRRYSIEGQVQGVGFRYRARYEVVQQLKDARKAQDMTQEVLAERVGTKKSNISRFESGKYNPSLDFLIKVAGSIGKQVQIRIK